jgi:enoyl-CoA hydratase
MDLSALTSGKLAIDYPAEHVVRVTLDDPDNLNAIGFALHEDLNRIWPMIDREPSIRAAIITGRGRAFCAGGALSDAPAGDPHLAYVRGYEGVLSLTNSLVNMRKPLVSAINGPAVGAGLALALLADVSIAAEDAKLIEGHLKNGLIAGDHAALIWPLLCGLARTKYHVMLGEPISGREAAECNLVSQAVPREALEARSVEVAARLAQTAPVALRMTKHVLNYWLRNAMPVFELSASLELALLTGPEAVEAAAARAERRAPVFDAPPHP